MKRYGYLWERLVSFENILCAFHQAVRGKGLKPYTLHFIRDFEHNILNLQRVLITKSYKPGDYNTFFIYEPKKRMISAAPFTDRIVHHCLINVIGPIFEPTFIHQSYANRGLAKARTGQFGMCRMPCASIAMCCSATLKNISLRLITGFLRP